jgi:hypothetical protein
MVGCSPHSLFKQEMLGSFWESHVPVCREIARKYSWPAWEYLYLDLFAGPGYLPNYPDVPGSPVIASESLAGTPHRIVAFEANGSVASELASRLPTASIHGRHQDDWGRAVAAIPAARRCGLIYADPNALSPADPSLFDTLRGLAGNPATKYLDILLHIPATTYKRVQGLDRYASAPSLDAELRRIGKRHCKLSRPDNAWQWTFILLTNFAHPRFARSLGWHDAGSPRGRLLLDRITMTAQERESRKPAGYLFDPE